MDMNHVIMFLVYVIIQILCQICKAEKVQICEDQTELISCGSGYTILIDNIQQSVVHGGICTKTFYEEICTPDFSKVRHICNGRQNCLIKANSVKESICYRYSRYIRLSYLCINSYINYYPSQGQMCSAAEQVTCQPDHTILYTNVTILTTDCDKSVKETERCIQNGLVQYCNNQLTCEIGNSKDQWCFYLPFSISLQYRCVQGKENPSIEESTDPLSDLLTTNKGILENNKEISSSLHIGTVIGCIVVLFILILVSVAICRKWCSKRNNRDGTQQQVVYKPAAHDDSAYIYIDVGMESLTQTSDDVKKETSAKASDDSLGTYDSENVANLTIEQDQRENIQRIDKQHQMTTTNANTNDDQFATHEEVVYDIANVNRNRSTNNVEIYSHAIDGVYDVCQYWRENDKEVYTSDRSMPRDYD